MKRERGREKVLEVSLAYKLIRFELIIKEKKDRPGRRKKKERERMIKCGCISWQETDINKENFREDIIISSLKMSELEKETE